jgi:hypothetical protein
MATSQNACFSGEAAADAEFEHPPGAAIARLVKAGLAKRGWDVSEIDNWRDVGWCATCFNRGSKLDLVIAKKAVGSEWCLQVAPSYVPGLLGRLLSKRASALPEATLALARDVFSVLVDSGRFWGFMWCWDGYPAEGNSTSEPVPPRGRLGGTP